MVGIAHSTDSERLLVRSPAKINLTLAVGPRQADGYHELESIVALLDFGDDVHVSARDDRRIVIECDTPGVPTDDTNLAAKAANALRAQSNISAGATIRLTKRIPAGAGLGGGSSNAATTMMLLRDVWKLSLKRDELATIAATIGSDVPLFFHGPLCTMRGRGEIVQPLAVSLVASAVLVMPPIHSATAAVYRQFDALSPPPKRESADELIARLSRANASFPEGPRQLLGEELMSATFNDLEAAAFGATPELRDFATRLREVTGREFRMTGSGAAFFCLFGKYYDRRELDGFADAAKRLGSDAVVIQPVH